MSDQKNMTSGEIIDVVQAFRDGYRIQYQTKGSSDWCDIGDRMPVWNFNIKGGKGSIYRVKPKPEIEVRYGRIELNGSRATIVIHFGPNNNSSLNNLELTFEDKRLIKARVL